MFIVQLHAECRNVYLILNVCVPLSEFYIWSMHMVVHGIVCPALPFWRSNSIAFVCTTAQVRPRKGLRWVRRDVLKVGHFHCVYRLVIHSKSILFSGNTLKTTVNNAEMEPRSSLISNDQREAAAVPPPQTPIPVISATHIKTFDCWCAQDSRVDLMWNRW